MAARKNKGTKNMPWPDSVRQKIQSSMLVNSLIDHALGKREMSKTQVTAALGLIRKVLPDLSSVQADMRGAVGHYEATAIPVAEREPIPPVDAASGSTERRH